MGETSVRAMQGKLVGARDCQPANASVNLLSPAITRDTSFFANTRASNLRSPSELLLGNMRGLQSLLARRPVREVVHRDGGGSSAKIEQD